MWSRPSRAASVRASWWRQALAVCVVLIPFLLMSRSAPADAQTGLTAKVYRYPIGVTQPVRSDTAYTLCPGAWTTAATLSRDFGMGSVGDCVADFVLIHLTGFVEFQQAGPSVQRQITFASRVDDGIWFTFNGTEVIQDWAYTVGGPRFASVEIETNQSYPIDVWYNEVDGLAKLDVTMSVDGGFYEPLRDGASCGSGCTVRFTPEFVPTTTTTSTTTTTTTTPTTTTTTPTTNTTTSTSTTIASTTTIPAGAAPTTSVPAPTTTRPVSTSTTVEPAVVAQSSAASSNTPGATTTTITPTTTATTSTTTTTAPVTGAQTPTEALAQLVSNPLAGGDPVRFVELTAGLTVGEQPEGRDASARAFGLAPGSSVTLTLHSDPVVLGTTTVGATGEAALDARFPSGIAPGLHLLMFTGTRDNGEPISSTIGFTVADDGSIAGISPASESASHSLPSASDMGRALETGLSLYDPNANAASVAALGAAVAVAAAAASSVLAGGAGAGVGSSGGSGGSGQGKSGRSESQADLAGVDLVDIGTVKTDRAGWGDRSRLWRAVGGRHWIELVSRMSTWSQPRSTLLTRSLADGASLRAMFGSVDALVCAAGATLGLAAASSEQWLAVAPATGWVVAISALSLLNALAGLSAAVMFVVPVTLAGNAFTVYDARTLLGIAVLFVAPALLANAIRPLRRDLDEQWWWFDRIADYLIAPLFLGLSLSSVFSSLNGLSGLEMVTGSESEALKYSVMGCAVARLLVEDLAARNFPRRLAEVTVEIEAEPGKISRLVVLAIRGFIYLSVAAPFFGLGWQTWTMLGLVLAVPFLNIVLADPPNSAILHRFFPRGILRTVIMMFVASWLAGLLFGDGSDPERIRAMTVWMLLPGVALGFIDMIAREGGSWSEGLWKRIAGGGLWAYSALILLGYVSL